MRNELIESKAQLETWALKDAAWAEVAHLPLIEALRERTRISNETVRRLGMDSLERDPRQHHKPAPNTAA